MAVIIGSARIDENEHAHGGSAGDQKQSGTPDRKGEVSMQDFYVHSKGWYIFRAKKAAHAKNLAKSMKRACNNPNIGYDQYQRDGIVTKGTDTKTKTECDCSSLVRRCIIEACGKDPGNIRTVSMPYMLPKTHLFEPKITYVSGTKLYTGDILVTKTSGHTVIVVEGADRSEAPSTSDTKTKPQAAKPTLRRGNISGEVKYLQKDLKYLGFVGADKAKLSIDGNFGVNTEYALKSFQNKHKDTNGKALVVDGIYGSKTYGAMKNALKND